MTAVENVRLPAPTILVIDDAHIARMHARRALSGAGFAVVEAADGHEGLMQLRRHPEIGLVFCDMNMPRMNGIEFLEWVKATPGLAVPHVVMLTAEMLPNLVQTAKHLGVRSWLRKPCHPALIVATANAIVGAQRSSPEQMT